MSTESVENIIVSSYNNFNIITRHKNADKNTDSKIIPIKIISPIDFRDSGIENADLDIDFILNYSDLIFNYNVAKTLGTYLKLTINDTRWCFITVSNETYTDNDIKTDNLNLDTWMIMKECKGKFYNFFVISNDFKISKWMIPISKHEYEENQNIYKNIYTIMNKKKKIIREISKSMKYV